MRDIANDYVARIEARLKKNLDKEIARRRAIAMSIPEAEGARQKFLDHIKEYESEQKRKMPDVSALAQGSFAAAWRIASSMDEKEFFKRLIAGAEWSHLELTKMREAAS